MDSKRKRGDEEAPLWPFKIQRFMNYLSSFFTKPPVEEERNEPVASTSEQALFTTPRIPVVESTVASSVTSVSHTRSSTSQYPASISSSHRTSPYKIRVLENKVFLWNMTE
jgi:hypothetical protein